MNSTAVCVTADDYGLSRGINSAIESLAAASQITAVSVMGHRDAVLSTAGRLAESGVTVGVHLAFTRETPILDSLGDRFAPNYTELFARLLQRPRYAQDLLSEARAQIENVQKAGLRIEFINSHEHVHLCPLLWPMVAALARSLGLRIIRAALGQSVGFSAQGALALATRASWPLAPLAEFVVLSPLGVGKAGQLSAIEVQSLLARPFAYNSHVVRELCVHPATDELGRRAEYELVRSGRLARSIEQCGGEVLKTITLPH